MTRSGTDRVVLGALEGCVLVGDRLHVVVSVCGWWVWWWEGGEMG